MCLSIFKHIWSGRGHGETIYQTGRECPQIGNDNSEILWTWIYRNRASSCRSFKEPEGTAGKVLQEFNVEEEKLRELISNLVTPVQAILGQQKRKIPSTAQEQEGS